jgi:two-component system OmpR family sensor kinase/two-component system sensor histidine kinase QseC
VKSLHTRLLTALLALLLLASLAFGWATYRSVLAETQTLFDYQLRQMALSLRDQGEIAPEQVGAFADEQLDFVVQIWSEDGRSIYASRAHPALPARALLGFADVNAGGQLWRTFSVATRARVIQVAQPVPVRQRLAADAALRSVAPLLVVGPMLALLGGWIVARALRPLRRVAADLRARDEQSLAPLRDAGLPDEVAPLVSALNGLLARLGSTLDAQRAFVADAAHELRSPLTALKLQLKLLREASDDASRRTASEQLAQGVERAARLVEQLLALARAEPGAPAATEPLDLADVARQSLADLLPLASARGSELSLQADAPVPLHGERTALSALVRNLADNALRYSPAGARVQLRVALDDGAPCLWVDDTGPGIAAADRAKVFDRFVRRTAHGEAGSGLGLAIVRSVAQRHGATVTLADSPLGGLRVTVRWPRAAAPP